MKKNEPEDSELWKALTKDVKRLKGKDYADPPAKKEKPEKKEEAPPPVKSPPPPKAKTAAQGKEIDRRTAQKFSRGQMEIEGRLDLHGMTQMQAREALRHFITRSHDQGKRCVLVITGKGGRTDRPGVLRQKLPEFLADGGLSDIILKTARARPQHGGDGAVYVLLRRKR